MSKLVIFADYGLDDACATAYILQNRERWDRIDIAPIGGNVAADRALCNAKKLIAAAQADGLPVNGITLVDTTALPQPSCPLPDVHGGDGMGDLLSTGCLPPVAETPYGAWVKTLTGEYTVLSLGPATVPVRALADAPKPPHGDIVIMGGCNRAEPNYNGYEFNDGLDHAAFVRLLEYPHVCATLDSCRDPAFNYIEKRFSPDRLLGRLMNRSVELAAARHGDRCYIYDYIAALALCDPERFTVENVPQKSGGVMRELRHRQ